jgi:hypothetical protein
MGLLDDAIREHLDLKRRRGADPTDVERAEREALGPVRRAPEGAEAEAELAPGHDEEAGIAYDQADEPVWPDQPSSEGIVFEDELAESGHASAAPPLVDDAPGPDEHLDPPPAPADPTPVDRAPRPDASDPLVEEPEAPTHEQYPASEEPPAPAGREVGVRPGEETVEYDVERALGSEEGDEDVLEETPEFLQDTPDHDRLWFEQRPPKDFDFDG